MASLQHRGMIAGNSIVWKPGNELRVGDTVIRYEDGRYAYTAKVTSVTPSQHTHFSPGYVTVMFDDCEGGEYGPLTMVRIPPQNPRNYAS
jgi:hypothetical protein